VGVFFFFFVCVWGGVFLGWGGLFLLWFLVLLFGFLEFFCLWGKGGLCFWLFGVFGRGCW